jgi:hypothetical protein
MHKELLIMMASGFPQGSNERKALIKIAAQKELVFHAVSPRGAEIVKAWSEGGRFEWEAGTRADPTAEASGYARSEQDLAKILNNHFRAIREFGGTKFKVVVDTIGVKV